MTFAAKGREGEQDPGFGVSDKMPVYPEETTSFAERKYFQQRSDSSKCVNTGSILCFYFCVRCQHGKNFHICG